MDERNTFISKDSSFEGDISANRIVVAGTVIGNLTASSTIILQEYAQIRGDIKAPKVYIAENCYHEGLICLGDPDKPAPEKIDIGSSKSEAVEDEIKSESKSEKTVSVSQKKKNKLW
ncbi:polymer-forming cytoskeletal protein [Fodinibius sp. Rm-B-1B1-1]|uniref:bactofilin family protein n=1 Tax=Fodinibius alkaliphilus TaxID=3140241 RepID=UPI00315A6BA8